MVSSTQAIQENRREASASLALKRPIEAIGRIAENICFALVEYGEVDSRDQEEFKRIISSLDVDVLFRRLNSDIAYAWKLREHTDLEALEIDLFYSLVTSVLQMLVSFKVFDVDGIVDIADIEWFQNTSLIPQAMKVAERRIGKSNPLYLGLEVLLHEYNR